MEAKSQTFKNRYTAYRYTVIAHKTSKYGASMIFNLALGPIKVYHKE